MRFPHKVSVMLPKARALRRRMRRKQKMRRGEKDGQGEDQAATSTKPRAPEQAEQLPEARGSTEAHATKAAKVEEDTPPDWGDEESGSEEASSPRGHSEEPKTYRPDLGCEEREREEAGSPRGRAEEPSTQWPWGMTGRPSDKESGQLRPNEPKGAPPRKRVCPADKPFEPSGEPPRSAPRSSSTEKEETATTRGKVTLVPNLHWQVQRVQEYMARPTAESKLHQVTL